MNKKVLLIISIFLITGVVLLSRDSYASDIIEDNNNNNNNIDLVLEDNDNIDAFKINLLNYIDLVDNRLIPNTSFSLSNKLNENYDFMTKFAISFILDNKEYYDIINGELYQYIDEYKNTYETSEYIKLDKIYEITNNVFGVEYYYILNDYIEIKNDIIPLIKIDDISFDKKIDSILDIYKYDQYMDVIVKYMDSDIEYVYTLENINNRYIISNLNIRE